MPMFVAVVAVVAGILEPSGFAQRNDDRPGRLGHARRLGRRRLPLTTFDDDEYVYGALRAGGSGFLLKSMALDAILDAIRVVAAGDALIAPSVTRRLIADFAGTSGPAVPEPDAEPAADSSLIAGITDREREVLALVGQGLSNTEIAQRLVISAATAKTHVARLFAKLEARDRVHLAIIAFETGLVPRRR